jgi:hypothetical protein
VLHNSARVSWAPRDTHLEAQMDTGLVLHSDSVEYRLPMPGAHVHVCTTKQKLAMDRPYGRFAFEMGWLSAYGKMRSWNGTAEVDRMYVGRTLTTTDGILWRLEDYVWLISHRLLDFGMMLCDASGKVRVQLRSDARYKKCPGELPDPWRARGGGAACMPATVLIKALERKWRDAVGHDLWSIAVGNYKHPGRNPGCLQYVYEVLLINQLGCRSEQSQTARFMGPIITCHAARLRIRGLGH